jgi:hypothetical protein
VISAPLRMFRARSGATFHGIRPELRASVTPQPVARPWLAALWAWILGAPEPSCRKRRPSGHQGDRVRLRQQQLAEENETGWSLLRRLREFLRRCMMARTASQDSSSTTARRSMISRPSSVLRGRRLSLLRHMPASSAGDPPFGGEASLWVWAGPFRHLGGQSVRIPLTSWREEKYGTRASEKTRQLDKYEPYSTEG